MQVAMTSRRSIVATLFVVTTIALVIFATMRRHTIDKHDLADLWGCYSIEGRPLFTLGPDALTTPATRVAFTARQGRRNAYLDLARPMSLTRRVETLSFDPSPEPTGPLEVHRSTPRALLLPSASGPPILALRSECSN